MKDEDALLERKKKEREEKAFRDAYRYACCSSPSSTAALVSPWV